MTDKTELEVTQADREAAADLYLVLDDDVVTPAIIMEAERYRRGEYDSSHPVQAFARHRLATRTPDPTPVAWMNSGPCQHQWSHAPTVGYIRCIRCNEQHNHGTPTYDAEIARGDAVIAAWQGANPPAVPHDGLDRNTDLRGYIVGNGHRTKWRAWRNGFCEWVDDPTEATRYSFPSDANAVHAEDEDAWCVVAYATALAAYLGEA